MKVRQLDTVRHEAFPNLIFVQVHTDDGLIGLGETFFGPRTVEAYLHETLAPALFDRAIDTTLDPPADFTGYVGFSSSGAETRGNSAIDIALWDLWGQMRGLPLHQLLGDAGRTDLPVYNTCAGPSYMRHGPQVASMNWGIGDTRVGDTYQDLDAFLHHADDLASSLLEQGIRGMKIWTFDQAAEATEGQYISGPDLAAAIEPVEKIRRRVGAEMDVMIELHGLWNVPMAERIAAALKPYDLRWIEDPVRPHDFSALDRVARGTSTPIAVGETLGGRATLERMIDSAAIGVAIVDLAWAGGITEGRQVAQHAQARDLEVAFHDCTGPVVLAASTHLALSVPNAPVQEIVRAFHHGWYHDLVTELPPIENGRIRPADGPGLAMALQPDLLTRPGVTVRSSRSAS